MTYVNSYEMFHFTQSVQIIKQPVFIYFLNVRL